MGSDPSVTSDENEKAAAGSGARYNFGDALSALKSGSKVCREGWNANHVLGLQRPDENSANTLPYIYMVVGTAAKDLQGKRVPWVASQTDLLAEDWEVIA